MNQSPEFSTPSPVNVTFTTYNLYRQATTKDPNERYSKHYKNHIIDDIQRDIIDYKNELKEARENNDEEYIKYNKKKIASKKNKLYRERKHVKGFNELLKEYENKKVVVFECIGVNNGYMLQQLPRNVEYIFINSFMVSSRYYKYMFDGYHIDEDERDYKGWVFDIPHTVKKIYINNCHDLHKAYINRIFRLPYYCEIVYNPVDYIQLAYNRYVPNIIKREKGLSEEDKESDLYKFYSNYYNEELSIEYRARSVSYIEEINLTRKFLFPDVDDIIIILYDRIDLDKATAKHFNCKISNTDFIKTDEDSFYYSDYENVLKKLQRNFFM